MFVCVAVGANLPFLKIYVYFCYFSLFRGGTKFKTVTDAGDNQKIYFLQPHRIIKIFILEFRSIVRRRR